MDGPLRRHSEMAARDAQVANPPARHRGTCLVPGHPRRRHPRHALRCPERTTDRRHVRHGRRSPSKRPGAPISGPGRIGTVEARTDRTDEPRARAYDAGERRTRERPDAGERIEVWTNRVHHLPRGEHRLRRRIFRLRLRTGEPGRTAHITELQLRRRLHRLCPGERRTVLERARHLVLPNDVPTRETHRHLPLSSSERGSARCLLWGHRIRRRGVEIPRAGRRRRRGHHERTVVGVMFPARHPAQRDIAFRVACRLRTTGQPHRYRLQLHPVRHDPRGQERHRHL